MPLTNGEGPIGLIICPSRELARQVVACLAFMCMLHSCSEHYCLVRSTSCICNTVMLCADIRRHCRLHRGAQVRG